MKIYQKTKAIQKLLIKFLCNNTIKFCKKDLLTPASIYKFIIKEGFTTIYQQLITEQTRLEKQILSIKSKLQTFPKGNFICARNGTRYKWYISDGHISTYLPKKEQRLAEQLATKKYLNFLLKDLQYEKQALDSYLQMLASYEKQAEHMLTDMPEYKKLLAPHFKPLSAELLDWMHSSYEHNEKYPEQLSHKTISGHFVRSKSEALIDMALYMNKIPFRYECALQLGDTTLYPDFTIRHPETGIYYYWEHFGLMDQASYYRNTYAKLQLYNTFGIIPSIHLITTYETKEHPLSAETIEHIIEQYFVSSNLQ